LNRETALFRRQAAQFTSENVDFSCRKQAHTPLS
jgi:hypothetical protein